MVGKISHKTLLGWNINMLRKAFVDVKVIGSGTELLGDYEILRHLNWNIVNLRNVDVEWNGKVLCTGLKFFKTPMVTEGVLKNLRPVHRTLPFHSTSTFLRLTIFQ